MPRPITYFQLALTSTAPWNYSRWKNAEFDSLVEQIPQALDETARADLYKQAQTILQDEVPMINFLINTAVAGRVGQRGRHRAQPRLGAHDLPDGIHQPVMPTEERDH